MVCFQPVTQKIMKITIKFIWLILCLILISCEKEDIDLLSVSKSVIKIPAQGGALSFKITTSADSWNIENPYPDWIGLSSTSGNQKEAEITIEVNSRSLSSRAGALSITAGNAKPVSVTVSQGATSYLYEIIVDANEISFDITGGTTTLQINTDAPTWKINSNTDWLQVNPVSGEKGATTVTLTAQENDGAIKTGILTIEAESARQVEIQAYQDGLLYPNYNTNPIEPNAAGMSSSAVELASKMKVGWNIGNTLEATGGETAWGNPLVTEELIKLVKQNGFNAIRIPCSWNQYLENGSTAKIRASWLDRVKQVVQYGVDNDMYVILNIHWDGGWLENNVTVEKQKEVNAKQKAFWEQIATHLRDFDEHLLFASANEPHVENASQMAVLQSYHQTFVDAVRATGGRNSYRVLVVQGPSTDIEKTNNLMDSMPDDEIEDRLMAEIHYYTPYQFCLMTEDASWGKMFYYWGESYHSSTDAGRNATWGEESTLDNLMAQMKTKFVDNGIPVILGEYAVVKRSSLAGENLDLHLASRIHFLKYLTRQAIAHGIIPFYWDAGNMEDHASALFNRQNNTVFDQQALNAIMEGANQ